MNPYAAEGLELLPQFFLILTPTRILLKILIYLRGMISPQRPLLNKSKFKLSLSQATTILEFVFYLNILNLFLLSDHSILYQNAKPASHHQTNVAILHAEYPRYIYFSVSPRMDLSFRKHNNKGLVNQVWILRWQDCSCICIPTTSFTHYFIFCPKSRAQLSLETRWIQMS